MIYVRCLACLLHIVLCVFYVLSYTGAVSVPPEWVNMMWEYIGGTIIGKWMLSGPKEKTP